MVFIVVSMLTASCEEPQYQEVEEMYETLCSTL